ncbi:MAG: hypothetical protein RBU23_08435 [Candidatus Auribacterota bacterium]|jgi:phenylacetate-CoA ligase|nr:hypothetical protein [Candidatus Auribacterota bacterium]
MDIYELIQRIAYTAINDNRYKYYDMFRKNLTLSREEMTALQNKLINKLIVHAYDHTSYYRNIMQSLELTPDDIRCKEDLKKLPVLTKSTARIHLEDIRSDDEFGKQVFILTSGGSTGNQAYIYQSHYFNRISKAAGMRNNLMVGWKPCDKSVWFWGAPYEHQKVEKSLKSKLGIIINRRLLFNAYNYSRDDFSIWADRIESFKPKIIYGYSTILLDFAKFMLKNNISFSGIRTVVSTTEALQDRSTIEKAFDCNVYDQYGCREINGIGIESPSGIMRIADDVVALNISDQGEFIITALHSFGFPLINYKLGDKGEAVSVTQLPSSDPYPFTTMNLKIGRTTDNFINRDNRSISSSALSTYMSTFGLNIIEQQIIQHDYTTFTINCVPDHAFNRKHYIESITKALEEYFGENLKLGFNSVEKIPVEKSGKKLMFKRTFNLE